MNQLGVPREVLVQLEARGLTEYTYHYVETPVDRGTFIFYINGNTNNKVVFEGSIEEVVTQMREWIVAHDPIADK